MVKSVLGVNHQGLRDWLIQRVSAIMMAVYFSGLFYFFATHYDLAYYDWHELFTHLWMKVATLLVVASLLIHAWIGMWTVYTDYVKIFLLNVILSVLTILALISFFLATLLILWSV
jgi:succinate dehydrogenase / fumarate reductase membrane anchor subunit